MNTRFQLPCPNWALMTPVKRKMPVRSCGSRNNLVAQIVVVTPQRRFESETLKRLVGRPDTLHLTWRGFSAGSLTHRRVVYAWPDRQHLNDLWGLTS